MAFAQAFNGRYSAIIKKLSWDVTLQSQLLDSDILSRQDCAVISAECTDINKVYKLLDTLKSRPDYMFDLFCNALRKCSQGHVIKLFNQPMTMIDDVFRVAFKSKYDELCNAIVLDEMFFAMLSSKNIMLSDQVYSIKAKLRSSSQGAVSGLLETLERKDNEKFIPFCQILTETGQQHVVDILLRGPKMTSVAAGVRSFLTLQPKNIDSSMLSELYDRTTRHHTPLSQDVTRLRIILSENDKMLCKVLAICSGMSSKAIFEYFLDNPSASVDIPKMLREHYYYEFASVYERYMMQ